MGSWTFAEFSVGIIAGSIPPCRAFVLQTLHNFRGEAPSNDNMIDTPNSRFGHSFPLNSFSRIVNASSRSQVDTGAPGRFPARVWNREANRAASQESGRESILPLHNALKPSSEVGFWTSA